MKFSAAIVCGSTALAALLLLGACGLKGDLYLPENKPAKAEGANAATVPEEFTDNPPLPEPEGTGQSVDIDPAASPATSPAAAAGDPIEPTVQEEAEQDAAEAPDKDAAANDQSDAGKETAAEPEA